MEIINWLQSTEITNGIHWNGITNGGAILVGNGGALIATNATFVGNSATNGGAIRVASQGKAYLYHCTFDGNTANANGGAIHNNGGTLYVYNCIFTANSVNGTVNETGQIQGTLSNEGDWNLIDNGTTVTRQTVFGTSNPQLVNGVYLVPVVFLRTATRLTNSNIVAFSDNYIDQVLDRLNELI